MPERVSEYIYHIYIYIIMYTVYIYIMPYTVYFRMVSQKLCSLEESKLYSGYPHFQTKKLKLWYPIFFPTILRGS